MRKIILLLVLTMVSTSISFAQTFNGTGVPVTIPDATAGNCGNTITSANTGTACVNVPVSGISGSSTLTNLTVNFTVGNNPGTWIGDYAIQLFAPAGSPSRILMNQPGAATPNAGGCGDSSDLATGTTVTFADSPTGTTNNLPSVVAGLNATTSIPSGIYNTSSGTTSPGPTIASAFGGMTGAAQNGTWRLCFYDLSQSDTINVSGVTLNLNQTPLAASGELNGKLRNEFGRAIPGAFVRVLDTNTGEVLTARTSAFGYFTISNLKGGNTYLLEAIKKGYTVAPYVFSTADSLTEIELIGYR